MLSKAEEKWKARGWGLSFGGENDNEYVLRGMMWEGELLSFQRLQRRIGLNGKRHY